MKLLWFLLLTTTSLWAQFVTGISSTSVTATSATINWTTCAPSSSRVAYGLTKSYGSATPYSGTLISVHQMSLTGLTSGTIYHYQTRSTDSNGITVYSKDQTFTTLAAVAHSVSLSWTDTDPVTFNVYRGSTSGGPYSPLTHGLTLSSYVDLSVVAGETYYYVVTAVNASNVESSYSNQAQAVVPAP